MKTEKRKYKAPKKDTTILNVVAPYLVSNFTRTQLGIIGIVSFIASLFTIATGFKSLLPSSNTKFSIWFYDSIPSISNYGTLILIIGFILLIVCLLLISVLNYHDITWCENCKRDFGYDEISNPDEIETPTRFGFNVETIHHFRCKYCEHTKDYSEIHEYDKEGNLLH